MRAWVGVLVLAGGGCEYALRLDKIPEDAGAGSDRDEDGDTVPNAIDNCPGIPNPAQFDFDSDGVGDDCDAHGRIAGDMIVEAEMFDTGFGPSWHTITASMWMIEDSAVTSPHVPATSGVQAKLEHPPLDVPVPTIEIGLDLVDVGPDQTVNTSGSTNHFAPNLDVSGSTLGCWMRDADHTNGYSNLYITDDGGNNRLTDMDIMPEMTTGQSYTLRFTREDSSATCAVTGSIAVTEDALLTSAPPASLLQPSIEIDTMQLRVRYIVIYGFAP